MKTAERSRLGTLLKYSLLWHRLAHEEAEDDSLSPTPLPPVKVPVWAIIKKWREMAGPKGRSKHRPADPPVYKQQAQEGQAGSSS